MNIVFFGTSEFAVASLEALLLNGFNVKSVVTATDKPGGRGHQQLMMSPVKQYAIQNNLTILQPSSLKSPKFKSKLEKLDADLFVVVAFRMLPETIWSIPPKGTVNLHGSILPAYRGAAPINWAIINGETTTGISVFFIDTKIDTGAIIHQETINIDPSDDFLSLYNKMKVFGAKELCFALRKIETGHFELLPQDETLVSQAPKLTRENTQIDFNKTAVEITNFCRGLSPYPTAWIEFNGELLKVYKCKPDTNKIPIGKWDTDYKNYLRIGCRDGSVSLLDVQPQNKKRMIIKDYLNGAGNKLRLLKEKD